MLRHDIDILCIATTGRKEDKSFPDQWLMEMTYFLSMGLPPSQLRTDEKKRLAVQSQNFGLVEVVLYHKGSDCIWRRGIWQDEKNAVLWETHCSTTGRHYVGDVKARKVWQGGLWLPTTQKDAHIYYKECDLCQRMGQLTELTRMPH